MAFEKKFSLDNKYEVEDLLKYLNNISTDINISISVTEFGDKKPNLVLNGSYKKEELIKIIDQRRVDLHTSGQKDVLTGTLSTEYFEKRMATIDRSQVLPVAVINFNINDWKYVNDNFGDEESDRLIKVISKIILDEAKPYFVVGRMDGDVFGVVIPMALEGEAEEYVKKVKDKCLNYEDSILAPSVAAGIVYKTNIEETIEDLLSDAEYLMFEDKFEMKNAPKYRRRLEHALNPRPL